MGLSSYLQDMAKPTTWGGFFEAAFMEDWNLGWHQHFAIEFAYIKVCLINTLLELGGRVL